MVLDLYTISYFIQGIIYAILTIKIWLIYRHQKLPASLVLMLFFLSMSIGDLITGVIYMMDLSTAFILFLS
ncbi:MAG: hypothetical protein ACFFBD_07140 [Candidatus Hodarchaeota archaeon]